jgi:hypothetical protein
MKKKKIVKFGLWLMIIGVIGVLLSNYVIEKNAENKIFSTVDNISN